MKGKVKLMLAILMAVSCSRIGTDDERDTDLHYGRNLSHEKIVLGDRLENPYKTENITKALESLYPTKADRIEVSTTDLYVRFLPADEEEFDLLADMGLHLVDHPLDFEIVQEGDWYHDPEVEDDKVTWQYAVVSSDFTFPDVEYEIIDECHIAENMAGTRSDDGIDWEEVERQAYIMTGNAALLCPETKAQESGPSGRITIVDDSKDEGKPVGVKGVRVSCNSFVKFSHCYTDSEGYYSMDRKYSSDIRYRLVFDNEKGFSIGFNMILVPASVSTLGTAGAEGINMTVTSDSESKLYKRCIANNAAYDYYTRCSSDDLGITPPPSGLRLWLFHRLKEGGSVMMHHGAVLDHDLISGFLGEFAPLVKLFMPDVVLGVKNKDDYRSIYTDTCHELAHASHFRKTGTSYWNNYLQYVFKSYLYSGKMNYGDGTDDYAGHCEVAEMWAYYLASKIAYERYGGTYDSLGTSFWFRPQVLRYIEECGVSCAEIFSVLEDDVDSADDLQRVLITGNPGKSKEIEQIFNRYK